MTTFYLTLTFAKVKFEIATWFIISTGFSLAVITFWMTRYLWYTHCNCIQCISIQNVKVCCDPWIRLVRLCYLKLWAEWISSSGWCTCSLLEIMTTKHAIKLFTVQRYIFRFWPVTIIKTYRSWLLLHIQSKVLMNIYDANHAAVGEINVEK